MDSLNITIMIPPFDKSMQPNTDIIQHICNISKKIKVNDASAYMMAEFQGDFSQKEKLNEMLADADVVFGLMLPDDLLSRAPKLKWVQMMSAGADRLRDTDIWQSKIIITGVSGIHSSPIGEFVLGIMLMFAKELPHCIKMQQKHEWQRYTPRLLAGKTVGIIGLGHIGKEVARLSKSFGMKVIATRRSVKHAGKSRNVDLLLPQSRMNEMLFVSDYIVLSVPLTPETGNIIGEAEFGSMKPGAYIINIGRGGLIDEKALIHALDERQIAGAGLDVTVIEPLPEDSRLWDMDNVILTPHVAGGMEEYAAKAAELFCDNLHRYLEGKKLHNIIDRKKGY